MDYILNSDALYGDQLPDLQTEYAREVFQKRNTLLESLALAFMTELNLPPSKIKLIEVTTGNKISWHFEALCK